MHYRLTQSCQDSPGRSRLIQFLYHTPIVYDPRELYRQTRFRRSHLPPPYHIDLCPSGLPPNPTQHHPQHSTINSTQHHPTTHHHQHNPTPSTDKPTNPHTTTNPPPNPHHHNQTHTPSPITPHRPSTICFSLTPPTTTLPNPPLQQPPLLHNQHPPLLHPPLHHNRSPTNPPLQERLPLPTPPGLSIH
jgi:hypothetical protein